MKRREKENEKKEEKRKEKGRRNEKKKRRKKERKEEGVDHVVGIGMLCYIYLSLTKLSQHLIFNRHT